MWQKLSLLNNCAKIVIVRIRKRWWEFLIELLNVSKAFTGRQGTVQAVDNLSLQILKGEVYGIVGESGAGKSTVLRFINLLERPDQGEILIDGINLCELSQADLRLKRKSIGMIFQHFNLLSNKTVAENITLPLKLHQYEDFMDLDNILEFVGLSDKRNHYPSQLSGGQKQRVGIARALITKPEILLCDEPTSALDVTITDGIVSLLKRAHETLGMTIVMVTHELSVVQQLCHKVAVLEGGQLKGVFEHQPSLSSTHGQPFYQRVAEVIHNE